MDGSATSRGKGTHSRTAAYFTLVELLVVIAIISVLASFLMPALQKVREQALVNVCANNLRQLGIATTSYVGDYNEYVPCKGYSFAVAPTNQVIVDPDGSSRNMEEGWSTMLWSYAGGNPGVYNCPKLPRVINSGGHPRYWRNSFGINTGAGGRPVDVVNPGAGAVWPYDKSHRIIEYKRPEELVYLTIDPHSNNDLEDGNMAVGRKGTNGNQCTHRYYILAEQDKFRLHEGKFNALFCNLVVRSQVPEQLTANKHWFFRGY